MTSELDIPYATKIVVQEFMGLNLILKFKGDSSKNIRRIVVESFTPDEWKRYALLEVTKSSSKTEDEEKDKDTPYDQRFGILDAKKTCPTCNVKGIACQNHFGIIPLCVPVYNRIFIKNIVDVLNCSCSSCGESRRTKSFLYTKLLGVGQRNKLNIMKTLCKTSSTCENCNSPLNYYYCDNSFNIYEQEGDKRSREDKILTTTKAYEHLSIIKNWVVEFMGFLKPKRYEESFLNSTIKKNGSFRPESMMFINFPVIPLCCRPWIEKEGVRNDDDLTGMYNQIIKANKRLKSVIDGEEVISKKTKIKTEEELVKDLQTSVNLIFTTKNQVFKKGKQKKGIIDRLRSKNGHIINNVGGKRCNFTSRGVIVGGGPMIPMGWIGVPRKAAETLTVNEKVTEWNLEYMRGLIRQNLVTHIHRNGRRIVVARVQNKDIFPGDEIYRKAKNGDVGIWNRQPSIREESLQGHRIIITEDQAYRMSTSETKAYNADFDGDEMNFSLVQTTDAMTELRIVSSNAQAIVTAQDNSALMSCVQNTIILMYIITNIFKEEPKEFYLKKSYFHDAVISSGISLERYNEFLTRLRLYYPELFREVIVSEKVNKKDKDQTAVVYKVRDVECLADEIPGKAVASIVFPPDFYWEKKTNTNPDFPSVRIIRGIIQKDSGPICKKTIGSGNTAIQYLYANYSPSRAQQFITETSFLAYALLPFIGFSVGISDCLLRSKDKLEENIGKVLTEIQKVHATEKDKEEREKKICEIANSAMGIAPILVKTELNKGTQNSLTIMNVSGTKGNDTNTGQLSAMVGQQNIDGKRPVPTLTNKSRTMVHFPCNSDKENPLEKGLISNSYLDGLTMPQALFQSISGRRGVIDTASKTSSSGYTQKKIGKKIEDCVVHPDVTVRNAEGFITSYLYGGDGMDARMLMRVEGLDFPFFFDALMEAKRLSSLKDEPLEVLPTEVIEQIILPFIHVGPPDFTSLVTERATDNMRKVLRTLLVKVKICRSCIPEYCSIMKDKFVRSKIPHGSTVGMNACLSIGEIVMQLTLNTHRTAGSASGKKDITTGLPRFKEVIDTSKNAKSSIVYSLKKKLSEREALRFCWSVEETKLEDLLLSKILEYPTTKEYGRPYFEEVCEYSRKTIFEKEEWLEEYFNIFGKPDIIGKSEWCLLLTFDLYELYRKNLDLVCVSKKINEYSFDSTSGEEVAKAIFSPLCIGKIAVFFDTTVIKKKLSKRKRSVPGYVTEENEDYYLVTGGCKDFLKDCLMSGIEGIKRTSAVNTSTEEEESNFLFVSNGSNVKEILNLELVETKSVYTSDFWESCREEGIFSSKTCLEKELTDVISANGSSSINPRHTSLLIDSMNRTGFLTSANRHGIKDTGFITRVMFETPIEQLKTAVLHGEVDPVSSMSSYVFVGATGIFGPEVVSKA